LQQRAGGIQQQMPTGAGISELVAKLGQVPVQTRFDGEALQRAEPMLPTGDLLV
jgi:hypothetical protein